MVVSSTDGYCTIIRFDSGELGVPLTDSELPVGARRATLTNMDVSPPAVHTPTSVPSSSQTTPHREVIQVKSTDNSSDELNSKSRPRRVQLITLSTTPQSVAAAATATTNNATTQDNTIASDTSTITSVLTSAANDVIIL